MRTTLDLDDELMQRALKESGARSKTQVIEMGLQLVIEREARRRLKKLYGKVPDVEPAPRRRTDRISRRRS